LIFEIGRNIGGTTFVAEDFKKRGGFQRSVELARELGLCRQNFCGCCFSAPHGSFLVNTNAPEIKHENP